VVTLSKNQEKWGFVCGRIAALEASLLPQELFVSLVGLERTEDIFHRLQDTFLRESMPPSGSTWNDWTATIDQVFHNQVIGVRADSPNPAVANLFLLANDFLNLKHAILNQPPYPFFTGILSGERLSAVAGGDINLLPDELRPFVAMLGGASGSEGRSAALGDIVLDGAYLRQMLALGAQLDNPFINVCLNDLVLGQAVVTLWRVARSGNPLKAYSQYFLPLGAFNTILSELIAANDVRTWGSSIPGEVGDLWDEAQQQADEEQGSRFEQLVSNHITGLVKQAKLQTAGPERVFAYLWARGVEAFNLKLLISGRVNQIDPEILKQRLRACYV